MILYLLVRLSAWMWCFPWPLQNEDGRTACAAFSVMEMIVELAAIAMLCMELYDNRKNGGAK